MGADQFNIRQMRNNVTFCHPAPFVRYSEQDGILSASGADWFANISVSRNGKRFWVGLSMWPEGESAWLAHFHQRTFAWLQRITSAGERELDALIGDVQDTLLRDPSISRLTWYREADMNTARPNGSPTPAED
jgi:hypothetical protein